MSIPITNEMKKQLYSARYPRGTRLKLTAPIDDPYSPKEAGDIFTVDFIDDAFNIHGHWKSGGSIAIIIEKDHFEIVT